MIDEKISIIGRQINISSSFSPTIWTIIRVSYFVSSSAKWRDLSAFATNCCLLSALFSYLSLHETKSRRQAGNAWHCCVRGSSDRCLGFFSDLLKAFFSRYSLRVVLQICPARLSKKKGRSASEPVLNKIYFCDFGISITCQVRTFN